MTPIDRNPDINLETEAIPEGMFLWKGKFLMHSARAAKIPFGVGWQWVGSGRNMAKRTQGLIIRECDRQKMQAALDNRYSGKKKQAAA